MHGLGTLKYKNGAIEKGEFKNGLFIGKVLVSNKKIKSEQIEEKPVVIEEIEDSKENNNTSNKKP